MDSLMNSIGSIMSVVVIVPFVVVGLFLLAIILRSQRRASASQNWPMTMGTVIASFVEPRRSSNGRGGTSTSYYPVVVYEYSAEGQRYQSRRIAFGLEVGGMSRMAEARIARYPVGSPVNVYYNPANPGEAVLEQRSPSNPWLILIVVVIVASVGCTLAFTLGMNSFMSQLLGPILSGIGR
jgi:hypothetical protein